MQIKEGGIENRRHAAKVLFFPNYFYLSYASYKRIIASLNCREVEGYVVHMHCKSFDESKQFPLERLRNDGCPFKQLPFVSIGLKGTSLFVKSTRFLEFLVNYHRIKRYLQAQQPDLIVVESDLGNMYMKLILDICKQLSIQIVITYLFDYSPVTNPNLNTEVEVPALVRIVLRLLRLERLMLFDGRGTGSYSEEAKMLVASESVRNEFVRKGVCRKRISVVGTPRHDHIHELLREPVDTVKSEMCRHLGWDTNYKVVVYCTQVIQQVYGEEYMNHVNKLLVHAFEELSAECRIVIKLHPREDVNYSEIFNGDRYKVIRDIDVDRLLRAADLAISHYSATLLDAALLRTPLLAINILNDPNRAMFASGHELVQINSETEFSKIQGMLYDMKLRNAAKAFLESWTKDNVGVVDGHSSERIADVIKHLIVDKGS